MKLNRLILIALFSVLVVQAQILGFKPMAYYENHPISEVSSNSSRQLQSYSEMVVGFLTPERLIWKNERAYFRQALLQKEYQLCPQEDLAQKSSSFFCSGVFIDKNLVLTAAHCVSNLSCKEFALVRNAQAYHFEFGTRRAEIHTCKKIQRLQAFDLAVIHTHETYEGILPKIATSNLQIQDPRVFMVGHPLGIPLYLSRGTVLQVQKDRFVARMSAFKSNSGSPVFSLQTGELLGLLVEGEYDFFQDPTQNCKRLIRCGKNQCKGETISRVPLLKASKFK